jgi:hypothetical protein
MNQVLQNMALFMLNDFCTANDINLSGTFVQKNGRGFVYSLRKTDKPDWEIARITFHKNRQPTFGWS